MSDAAAAVAILPAAGVSPNEWPAVPRRALTPTGAEAQLPDTIAEFQRNLRRFALEVMRPIGIELDRMSPEQVIAPQSPYWRFRRQYLDLGVSLEALAAFEPAERALVFSIVFEELGYGDAGLAISTGAGILPQYIAARFGNRTLMERFPDTLLGCWAITEPDHGSDTLDCTRSIAYPHSGYGRPNCVATYSARAATPSTNSTMTLPRSIEKSPGRAIPMPCKPPILKLGFNPGR